MTQLGTARFELGQVVITPGALAALQQAGFTPGSLLSRHAGGVWGTVCADDRQANEQALEDGGRIMSVYVIDGQTKLWVITEAIGDDGKRPSTCILLPEDY